MRRTDMWMSVSRKLSKGAALLVLICTPFSSRVQAQVHPQLERVLTVGDESHSDYQFGRVVGVARSGTGELVVLDGMNAVVRIYSPTGQFLRKFGRPGAGPGEFMLANRLLVTRDRIVVLDPRAQRVTSFDFHGSLLETVNTADHPVIADIAVPLRDGVWVAVKSNFIVGSAKIREIIGAAGGERQRLVREQRLAEQSTILTWRRGSPIVDTLFRFDPGAVFFYEAERGVPFGFVSHSWGPLGAWAVAGDSLFGYVNGVTGDVRIFEARAGKFEPLRSGRVPITPAGITAADLRRVEADARKGGHQLPRTVELSGPPFRPLLGTPLFGPDGALWIRRFESNASADLPHRYLVVPVDGTAQREVILPAGFTLRHVGSETLVGTRNDELGVESVEVWRWKRQGAR